MLKSFSSSQELLHLLQNLDNNRHEFHDRKIRGLILVQRKNGKPKWLLKYQCPNTLKHQRFSVGDYPTLSLQEARQIAMGVIQQEYFQDDFTLNSNSSKSHQNGSETSDELPDRSGLSIPNTPQRLSFKAFYLDHYLPYIKVSKRSWKIDVSILSNHILPILGGFSLLDIKPFLVQEMVNELSNKGLSASSVNRALIIVRFMFNCALKWQVIPKVLNPCKGVKEFVLNNKRERFITADEFAKLKLELQKSKNSFLPLFVQLLMLTGCRRGEAMNAKMVHLDLGRGDWIVPLPKGGRARHIPLNASAIDTIRHIVALKQSLSQIVRESEYLFPNPQTGEPFKQIFFSWDKARKAAGLGEVRMHDLRHSFASALVNSGMTLYDVKEILGHTNIKTTERYAHLNNTRLKAASSTVMDFYGIDAFKVKALDTQSPDKLSPA
jgi:integrase